MFDKKTQLKWNKKKRKATNNPKNQYFKWLRTYKPECIVCGALAEIHHIDTGYRRDDTRVVMLCVMHHSAQSKDGIHHSKEWYKRFFTFEQLEEIAEANFEEYKKHKVT